MARKEIKLSRRDFLKSSAGIGVSALAGGHFFNEALAASKERVTIYQNTGADSINPYNQSSGSIYGNWQHVIEPLVELDYAKKAWVGVLADSWQFRGNRWVFKLKKGIRFHNGDTFTSKDVVFSVEKMRDVKGGSLQASNFKEVVEIETPDDHTVVFVTKEPLAVFLDRLRNRFIVSKATGDKYGEELYQHLVGTGPYKFVSFQRGGNLVFTRNDDYWGDRAAIKEVVFRKITEDAARLAALESARPTSSTPCRSMKWLDCSACRACASTRSRAWKCTS
jgi:peptide/nickel transport system substrate-binding protein